MKSYEEITTLFKKANDIFIKKDKGLFDAAVSERTLCGALMLHLHDVMKNDNTLSGYYVDIEYNRNKGKLKTIKTTSSRLDEQIININCDLIVHSRGENIEQDNLLAIEMKKSSRNEQEKNKDRNRLMALTKDSFDDVWSFDGKSLPEHVCRYVVGIYYEVDLRYKMIKIEYYRKGQLVAVSERCFS